MEPLKLPLKLQLSKLNERDWKIPLNLDEQAEWRTLLVQFVDYHSIRIPRCIFPSGAGSGNIRLVCFSDAAIATGGTAIYAGKEINPGLSRMKPVANQLPARDGLDRKCNLVRSGWPGRDSRLKLTSTLENVHLLNMAPIKWTKSDPLPEEGDVVLFVTTENPSRSEKDGVWRLGRVLSVTPRRVKIEQVLKSGTKTMLERNPRDVSIVVGVEELAVNTRAYFSMITKEEEPPSQPSSL